MMPKGEFAFRSALIPTVVTLALLTLLVALGFWQLDRAHQKESIQITFERNLNGTPVDLRALDVDAPGNRFRQVEIVGEYDDAHQILLDNQMVDGRPGAHVYTPLKITGLDGRAILINRGWIPLSPVRQASPPALPVPGGVQRLSGRLAQPANPGLQLGEPDLDRWPARIIYLDYQQLSRALPYALLPAVVLLDPAAEAGFRRQWQPNFGGIGPERHRGYAVQWFALALTLLVLYLMTTLRRRRQ